MNTYPKVAKVEKHWHRAMVVPWSLFFLGLDREVDSEESLTPPDKCPWGALVACSSLQRAICKSGVDQILLPQRGGERAATFLPGGGKRPEGWEGCVKARPLHHTPLAREKCPFLVVSVAAAGDFQRGTPVYVTRPPGSPKPVVWG